MNLDGDRSPVQEGGVQPLLLEFPDRVSEAVFVSERIEAELKGGRTVGVLFRAAYLASELEVELTELLEDLGAAVGGAAVGTGVGAGAHAATARTTRTSKATKVKTRVRISSPPQ